MYKSPALRMLMHYYYFGMLQATAKPAADQVAGCTPLQFTKYFFCSGSSLTKNAATVLLISPDRESWSNGSECFMGSRRAHGHKQGAVWWKPVTLGWKWYHVPGFVYKDANILPLIMVNKAKKGIPGFLVPGTHSDRSIPRQGARKEQAAKSTAHGLLPFP